ncbi:hypothetical protein CS022_17585 [Veronia nyctiphanis]|uniref:Uncharacterized protein n=1 Tax=Veronia nyctiphanis TaxID=1278244 RepID=A0A4Q0YMJ9_9GAMM|nr:hypothetical protein CS022_17585 [Veronia nyctiphanis]
MLHVFRGLPPAPFEKATALNLAASRVLATKRQQPEPEFNCVIVISDTSLKQRLFAGFDTNLRL